MGRSDLYTHVVLVVAALVGVLAPGLVVKGYAPTMLVFVVGGAATIAIAVWYYRAQASSQSARARNEGAD